MSDSGTCGFCGFGDGRILDTGHERSEVLNSSVKTDRVDENGLPVLERHPGAWDSSPLSITWCGTCLRGLAHKWQRYDDHNLMVQVQIYELWDQMDGLRWSAVSYPEDDDDEPKRHPLADDMLVHIEKLRRHDEIPQLRAEIVRRAGYVDLTQDGEWRE